MPPPNFAIRIAIPRLASSLNSIVFALAFAICFAPDTFITQVRDTSKQKFSWSPKIVAMEGDGYGWRQGNAHRRRLPERPPSRTGARSCAPKEGPRCPKQTDEATGWKADS